MTITCYLIGEKVFLAGKHLNWESCRVFNSGLSCSPSHPFLSLTLANVLENIRHYDPSRMGVGKKGVLRLTGTIPYSRSIYRLRNFHPCRIFDSEKAGLIYSIFGTKENPLKHENKTHNHYSRQMSPIIKKVNGTSK